MEVEMDAGGYDLNKANTSRPARPPETKVITIENSEDSENLFYDMSKKKYLHIFNHFRFSKTREFGNEKPTDRKGTHFDVKILEKTFEPLGFETKVHQDLTRYGIKKTIEKIINQNDHSKTSCIALAILTHGSYDGYLFAEDQPYELKEITKLLEHQKLAMIPKLLFLQVSMVMDVLPPRPMLFQRMGSLRSSVTRFTRSVNSRMVKFYVEMRNQTSTTTCDAGVTENDCCNGACRGHALDKGHQVEVDGLPRDLIHVPSHIDFLILHSAADGHASFRCSEAGSWMIQSLCSIIDKHHKYLDILQLITLVNKRVAYDFVAFNKEYPTYNNKKQSLEARYTLTKFLKL